MIILHEKLLESDGKKPSQPSSPSAFFKSRWIKEKEQKKTFNHLYRNEIEQTLRDRLYLKKITVSDYEKFSEMMDFKRSSDVKIFSKLQPIIKQYQKLEFLKISEELEAVDCLFTIQNKKVMNHQTIKMLSQSLKQIEKHCQKIKKEIKNSMKKSRLKDEMTPSEIILKDNLGNDISASSILNEFNIIAEQCNYLSDAHNIKEEKTTPLFPEIEHHEIPLDYYINILKLLFECVDLSGFNVKDKRAELKTFCWEGVLQTPSIGFTPYSTFVKAYKRCENKDNKSLGLSLSRNSNEFYQFRDQILSY
tara:strand:- start:2355 stop:3272 length:918 start_codon:yes stop_codon:yes gene_type:complete